MYLIICQFGEEIWKMPEMQSWECSKRRWCFKITAMDQNLLSQSAKHRVTSVLTNKRNWRWLQRYKESGYWYHQYVSDKDTNKGFLFSLYYSSSPNWKWSFWNSSYTRQEPFDSSLCSSTQWETSYIMLFHQKLRLRYTLLTSPPNIFFETCPAALLAVYPNLTEINCNALWWSMD